MMTVNQWKEFEYGVRFTDEQFALFTEEELSMMRILSKAEAQACWKEKCDREKLDYASFVSKIPLRNLPLLIDDCRWGDEAGETSTEHSMEELFIVSDTVLILYNSNTALQVQKSLLCSKWSDFCYPSDIVILVNGEKVFLYYEDMLFSYNRL